MLKMFSRAKSDPNADLHSILNGYELPTFPAVYMQALQQVRDEQSSAADLANVIATDPGLTMRLLGTANSAAYGLRSEVKSVHHAVSILGRGHVESMLLSLASRSALPRAPTGGFEPARFWKAAARRASTARALAECVNPAEQSECFTAGLLQDMAIPVLASRVGAPYHRVLERWHNSHEALHEMERAEFGWDHAQVAALMCVQWAFPESITEAIVAHHGSEDPDVCQLVPVNVVSLIREVEEPGSVEAVIEHVHLTMGLATEAARELIDTSFQNAEGIAQQFA